MRNIKMSPKAEFSTRPAPFVPDAPTAKSSPPCACELAIIAAIVFFAVFTIAIVL